MLARTRRDRRIVVGSRERNPGVVDGSGSPLPIYPRRVWLPHILRHFHSAVRLRGLLLGRRGDFYRLSAVFAACRPVVYRLSAVALTVAWSAIDVNYAASSRDGAEFAAGQLTGFDNSGSCPESRREFPAQRIVETRLVDPG